MKKTLIGIPCMDHLPLGFAQSLMYLDKPEGTSVLFKANSLVYDSRNVIALTAIEKGFDRVMWFDSDMVFTPQTMKILHDDMDKMQCHMVTGVYFQRTGKHEPVIYRELDEPTIGPDGRIQKHDAKYTDYPLNNIFTVDGCGFGCVMTSVKLLKDVWDHYGTAFLPYPWAGEDLSFCHRVNQLGYQIYCDSTVSCGHIGNFVYTEDFYLGGKGVINK